MTRQLCKRDLAILERGLAIPPTISLAVDDVQPLAKRGRPAKGSKGDITTFKSPKTFADRIASSPQLVSATITRAIKLKAHRERQAARPPVMAVRMAGSK